MTTFIIGKRCGTVETIDYIDEITIDRNRTVAALAGYWQVDDEILDCDRSMLMP